MSEQEKQVYIEKFNRNTHALGRLSNWLCLFLFIGSAFFMGAVFGVMPDMNAFFMGFAQIALIYIPSCIVEFLIYTPMLGSGASYLAFITGNLINLKIPCAVNAREIAGTSVGTPENEIVSTLSVAASSLTTTLVIAVGVLAMTPLRPVLENPALQPAFNNVVPALFGALAYMYFRKDLRIVPLPLAAMILLCVLVPSVISSAGFLIVPSGALAIGLAYYFFKKDQKKEVTLE